ncbi:MAG: DUF3530 family protein [Gammaproteobacteria bacterium]
MIFPLALAGLPGTVAGATKPATATANAAGTKTPAPKEDTAKEKRWAKQLAGDLVVGEPQWLTANGTRFLALYTRQTDAVRKGALILLHGMGAHPDWPGVIHSLRVELPDHGWSTLSLQMPVLPSGSPAADYASLFDVAAARIQAGIDFLHKQGVKHIALAGHSMGAAMGAWFLANHPGAGVETFVGIGMNASVKKPRLDTPAQLAKIHVPVLDLYGSEDLEGVVKSAQARAAAAHRAGNTQYRQQQVAGADHFFDGLEDELVLDVRGWLRHVSRKPGQQP